MSRRRRRVPSPSIGCTSTTSNTDTTPIRGLVTKSIISTWEHRATPTTPTTHEKSPHSTVKCKEWTSPSIGGGTSTATEGQEPRNTASGNLTSNTDTTPIRGLVKSRISTWEHRAIHEKSPTIDTQESVTKRVLTWESKANRHATPKYAGRSAVKREGYLKWMIARHYLPALADPSVQQQLTDMRNVYFDIQVLEEGSYVSLKKLALIYSQSELKNEEAEKLQKYLSKDTKYRWYWRCGFGYEPYSRTVSQKLEKAFLSRGSIEFNYLGIRNYTVDTASMTQTNIDSKREREIERRPTSEIVGVSLMITANSDQNIRAIKAEITKKLKKYIRKYDFRVEDPDSHTELLQKAKQCFVTTTDQHKGIITLEGTDSAIKDTELQLQRVLLARMKLYAVRKPDYWESPQEEKLLLRTVVWGTAEWFKVEQRMTAGFAANILRIERIQNKWLWGTYYQSRQRMSEKNNGQVNEEELFHGTRGTPPIKIYNSEQGFDNRLAHRGMWGEGAYFAVSAKYSNDYAHTTPDGHRQLFLVTVITGITCKCQSDRSLKAPPTKADYPTSHCSGGFEDERYDSVNGYTNGSEVFVIYEPGKIYPAYLITYSLL